MTAKPFRFGVVGGQAPDMAAWTALARRTEELGRCRQPEHRSER